MRKDTCYVPTLRFQYQTIWEKRYVKDFCEINPKTEELENEFIYIDLESVSKGRLLSKNIISKKNAPSRAQRVLKNDDILFQCVRPYQMNNLLFNNDGDDAFQYVASTGYAQIRTHENPSFTYHLLHSPNFNKNVLLRCTGSSYPAISSSDIEDIETLICGAEEQEKIGKFCDLIDMRISVQNKIIEDLKVLKKTVMDYILNICSFKELSIQELIDAGYARIIKASELKEFDGTKEYISTSSIGEDGIEQIDSIITYSDRPSRASMLPIKDSIWFAKMKNSVKVYQSTADDEKNYIFSTGFYGLLCNEMKVNPCWLIELFKSDYFNTQKDKFSEGSSMSGIKDSQLADIKLKVFANKTDETYHTNNIKALSKKIQLEKNVLKKLLIQKQFFLNAMFI